MTEVSPRPLKKIKSFTLVELIIVVIIVGILASLGLTQYSQIVEKSRLAEAKIRIGVMKNLAYQYYLEKGTLATITSADVDGSSCNSNSYYSYTTWGAAANYIRLNAVRCGVGSGGKEPNVTRQYQTFYHFYPDGSTACTWGCQWVETGYPACPYK
jgi:prepilin-type N-terminal cleavage/methylation domain-containing protein